MDQKDDESEATSNTARGRIGRLKPTGPFSDEVERSRRRLLESRKKVEGDPAGALAPPPDPSPSGESNRAQPPTLETLATGDLVEDPTSTPGASSLDGPADVTSYAPSPPWWRIEHTLALAVVLVLAVPAGFVIATFGGTLANSVSPWLIPAGGSLLFASLLLFSRPRGVK